MYVVFNPGKPRRSNKDSLFQEHPVIIIILFKMCSAILTMSVCKSGKKPERREKIHACGGGNTFSRTQMETDGDRSTCRTAFPVSDSCDACERCVIGGGGGAFKCAERSRLRFSIERLGRNRN